MAKRHQLIWGVVCITAHLLAVGCVPAESQTSAAVPGGDAGRGKQLVTWYGCEACHEIPSVRSARGRVGPPLAGVARRAYLAGKLPNTAENMMLWVRTPQAVDAGTVMPNLDVTDQDARDIAASLYTLQ